ncbi:unnamed protein product [Closterium sp. NIES-53]
MAASASPAVAPDMVAAAAAAAAAAGGSDERAAGGGAWSVAKEGGEEANLVVQRMLSQRLLGQDFNASDILQLYTAYRRSGATVGIDSDNSRDALFRAAIHTAFSAAAGNPLPALPPAGIPLFLACLAAAIRLPSPRALTMVLAALAARTRSSFLQAWALVKQNRHSEAEEELQRLASIATTLPPPPNSAEMEMVAAGLAQRISHGEREELLWVYCRAGRKETRDAMARALGL